MMSTRVPIPMYMWSLLDAPHFSSCVVAALYPSGRVVIPSCADRLTALEV